jgi:hypothetical protein
LKYGRGVAQAFLPVQHWQECLCCTGKNACAT